MFLTGVLTLLKSFDQKKVLVGLAVQFAFCWKFHLLKSNYHISFGLRPWRRGIVVIASAYRIEDPGFESRRMYVCKVKNLRVH
jgi:hypothetical protein